MKVCRLLVVLAALMPAAARAEDRLITDESFTTPAPGPWTVDAGLLVALPAALPTGLTSGIGASITRHCGCHLEYGATASWSTASIESITWTVTHGELRLRATAGIRRDAGRGTFALRLGAGTSVVHEDRVRNQGMRAGLTGSDLETTATAALPAADVQAVVTLRVIGPWAMVIAGGPTATWFDSHLRGGWTATLGVAWYP